MSLRKKYIERRGGKEDGERGFRREIKGQGGRMKGAWFDG